MIDCSTTIASTSLDASSLEWQARRSVRSNRSANSTLLQLISRTAYANPLFLRLILLRFASDAPNARAQAYFFAALTLLAQLVRATVDMQQAWFERQVIVKVRTAIMGEVYVKGLTRMDASGSVPKKGSKRGKGGEKGGPASLGRIISMMNTDANK